MLAWMSIGGFLHSWLGSWSCVLWRWGYKQKTTLMLLFDKDMEKWRTQIAEKKKKNNAMGLDLLMFLNLILNTIYLYTAIGVKICLIFYLMFDIQCTVYKYAIYLIFFTSHMYKHNSFDSNKKYMFISFVYSFNHSYPISPALSSIIDPFSQGHSVGSPWFTRCCRESRWCVGGIWKFHPWMTNSHGTNGKFVYLHFAINICWWKISGDHQLILVNMAIIYEVLYIPGGAGFLNHQQYQPFM